MPETSDTPLLRNVQLGDLFVVSRGARGEQIATFQGFTRTGKITMCRWNHHVRKYGPKTKVLRHQILRRATDEDLLRWRPSHINLSRR